LPPSFFTVRVARRERLLLALAVRLCGVRRPRRARLPFLRADARFTGEKKRVDDLVAASLAVMAKTAKTVIDAEMKEAADRLIDLDETAQGNYVYDAALTKQSNDGKAGLAHVGAVSGDNAAGGADRGQAARLEPGQHERERHGRAQRG
jgi:hypothetical protein